jgi:membrane-bound metal-dependent hydrolase YbcI (DUF457 family)
MRVLLRVLAPLLGLAIAAAGVLLVIEVVAAWVRTPATTGLLVPWPDWRVSLEGLTWADAPVPVIAIIVAVVGLLLMQIGFSARRRDVALISPTPEVTVTTSPRVLARLVGRRVRATDGVAAASVTATGKKISVGAQAWNDAGSALRSEVGTSVDTLLDDLPLARRPRVAVTVQQRKGPR